MRTSRRVQPLTRMLRIAAVVGAGSLAFGMQPTVHAGSTSGIAQVSCEASFPHIPATTWTSGGTCRGTATIEGVGIDDADNEFALDGSGSFTAEFDYHEPCLADGQPAIVLSFASGSFTIDGVSASHPIGRESTATITGSFAWDRVGANPVITVSDVTITFSDALGGQATGEGVRGGGTATFVPPGSFNTSTHLLCGQSGGPLTIPVTIAAALAL